MVKLDDGSGRQFARKRTWTTEEFMWEAITEAYIMKLGEVVPAYVVQFQVLPRLRLRGMDGCRSNQLTHAFCSQIRAAAYA